MAKKIEQGTPVALIGGESLLGKELHDLIETRALPAQLRLISSSDEHGNILTEHRGELAVISPLQTADIMSAKVVLLAGGPESSRKAYELVEDHESGPVFIDVSRALEDNPQARLRAPMVEQSAPSGVRLHVIAHPAAIALAMLLRRLQESLPVRRCVVLVFEPASERGQPGLDELQQQTVGLLSFQKLKKDVYDAQVSFNLLPRFGEDAPRSLEDIELTIDRHLASLLAASGNTPMPSLRVVQAPVFHGYSFSLWVEFETTLDLKILHKALEAADHIEVRSNDVEPPSNVGVAGQGGITVGAIAADRNEPRACWLWMVADNLRIAAENALEVALEYLA